MVVLALFHTLAFAGCEAQPSAPSSRPDPSLVTPVDRTGPIRITFVSANVSPAKITEQDAIDILTTISLIHRRLDAAVRTHVP